MLRKAEELEKPIRELEQQIAELQQYPESMQRDVRLQRLEEKLDGTQREVYANLSRWQTTLVARHPKRPHTLDYIGGLCEDFVELHGDRLFRDDPAIVAGLASFEGRPVAVVGHQKGRNTNEKLYRNFGMPNPEGYRKALRVVRLAEKFGNPVLTFIDTPGAYPGSGAEERGVAESIAMNLREMAGLRTPIVATVIGEGGSGGALAIGVADRVNMLEHAVYSVISPESCSSILWRDAEHVEEAADALRLAAPDLFEMGIIDEIVGEPVGGAHADPAAAVASVGHVLRRQLAELDALDTDTLIDQRYQKFKAMGTYESR